MDKEPSHMKNVLIPVTVLVVLCVGYSMNWLTADMPHKGAPRLTAQEVCATEAALRHKQFLPSHWRSMVLQPH